MTELTHGKSDLAGASSAAWADRQREGMRREPEAISIAGFFFTLRRRLVAYWLHRSLRTLSDKQLRDAGIDPVHAGRGRAVAATADPNIGSGR